MGYIERHRVSLPVSVSAGATQAFFTSRVVAGFVEAIRYTRATASALSTNAGLVITGERSGIVILDVTATGDGRTWYPHGQAENVSGLGLLGVSTGDVSGIWPTKIPVAGERIKVEVASGGVASGVFSAGNFLDLYISGY